MNEVTFSQSLLEANSEDYETAIEQCWTEVERLREKITADQADIDRLKAETQAMLTELKTMVGVQ